MAVFNAHIRQFSPHILRRIRRTGNDLMTARHHRLKQRPPEINKGARSAPYDNYFQTTIPCLFTLILRKTPNNVNRQRHPCIPSFATLL
jgi:hypothetical protein